MAPTDRARRRRFIRRRVGVATLLVVVLSLLMLLGLRSARTGALPNIEVAGRLVGGLDRESLEREVAELAEERESDPIEVARPPIRRSDDPARSYRRSELGYSLDVETTVKRVLARGRQPNPLASLSDQLRASFVTIDVDPVVRLHDDTFASWIAAVSEELSVPPRDGDLRFEGARVRTVMPRPGVVIEEEAFRSVARRVTMAEGAQTIEAPTREVVPEMTREEVLETADLAKQVLSDPIVLRRGGVRIELPPRAVAKLLQTKIVEDPAELDLVVDPKALDEVGARLEKLERSPSDAGFELVGGSVRVVPSKPGFRVDRTKLARRLIGIATSKNRTGRAPGSTTRPELTTAAARNLNIDEKVSSFTTEHSCCEPRVQNIHRIADMIDGTVVKPGEVFSVNDAVGERTRAKGFVAAPAIFQGEYVDEVGGGISQFATTMFNAIFFGGYEFTEYKAHSYYISRYPMGREATLSWPSVDLAFRNDSDAGVYIDTSYTDTSITVTLYGKTNADVGSSSGDAHNHEAPPTQCEENRSLGKRERRVVQEGKRGFDIVVRRIFRNTDRDAERFFTRYLPEPRIVERRSCP